MGEDLGLKPMLARVNVVDRVRSVIAGVSGIPAGQIHETERLNEDLSLNSLERIETGMALEEEFGIALSDDEVDNASMSTVGGIADYLIAQRGVGG